MIGKIYKATEWQSPSGRWHCNDVQDLAGGSGSWWIPCRILGIAPEEYVKLLKERFNASNISYKIETNILLFSWENQEDMRKYKNFINKKAKEVNAII